MKKMLMLLSFVGQLYPALAQNAFGDYPVYTGHDLGLTYSSTRSSFRIWSPPAEKAELIIYSAGVGGDPLVKDMQKSDGGTWVKELDGNWLGKYYTFRVFINNQWLEEVTDPYAKAAGVNGKRAMVIDLPKTNPSGWSMDKSPLFKHPTDAVIYELHVRDASISENSGIKNKGKYLGLTETGTKNEDGQSTGLDHLKELGVTHVHLLPCFDFNSVDEAEPNVAQYNWGYDPFNYNIPEGSYATNAEDGNVRIKEFKELIQCFHKNGLRVIMDVVYNHTSLTEHSNFNQLVPDYYYRQTADGKFSNATACNNETASERPMMRKFIVESMMYWVKEYHVDGFRMDLMGVHDIATVNLISQELHRIKPDILLYGEGWTAGTSPLPDSLRAIKANAHLLNKVAVFSDDIRDAIKGSVFRQTERGFASGQPGLEESIKFGVAASCYHPQINYAEVNYSKAPYSVEPAETITYCECHDNHTLWDKLMISASDATEGERKEMQKLALGIILTSQGISFLHAGTEFLRTKHEIENSYNSTDSINAIDWSMKTKNRDVFDYVKGLIRLRREHPAFRMTTGKDIAEHLKFFPNQPGMVAYSIDGTAVHDTWKRIVVVYNSNHMSRELKFPKGKWIKYNGDAHTKKNAVVKESILIDPLSCTVYYEQ